jgi:hypothetical protein
VKRPLLPQVAKAVAMKESVLLDEAEDADVVVAVAVASGVLVVRVPRAKLLSRSH